MALLYDEFILRIYDLKTNNEMRFVLSDYFDFTPADKLAFKLDESAYLLGVLYKNGDIALLEVPVVLLKGEYALAQMASLVYCREQVYKKTENTMNCMGYALFENQNFGEEITLKEFVENKLLPPVGEFPTFLYTHLNEKSDRACKVGELRDVLEHIAKKLSITRRQVAAAWLAGNSNFEQQVYSVLNIDFVEESVQLRARHLYLKFKENVAEMLSKDQK